MRIGVNDGKTEWFIVNYDELRDIIMKIKLYMVRMFKDCGSEANIEELNKKDEMARIK